MTSFIDQLLEKHKEKYNSSIAHPLTNELCSGTLPDFKLFTYLVQDLKFFQSGMRVFGKTLALCDNETSAITLGRQIGFISNDENDYFAECIEQLKKESLSEILKFSSKMLHENVEALNAVREYIDLMEKLVQESNSYVELITFMYVMEQVYLGWADYNILNKRIPENLSYKYNEWIVLHSGEAFTNWTLFLKNEVIRTAKTEQDKIDCEKIFIKTLDLEISFFDACYNYNEN